MQPHPLICILLMASFALQQQSSVIAAMANMGCEVEILTV